MSQSDVATGDRKSVPTASAVLDGGDLLELIYRPDEGRTLFIQGGPHGWKEVEEADSGSERLVPYSAGNNLLRHRVILLPSGIEEYGSEEYLLASVRAFIHRYVDLSLAFEEIAAYYVLFTWLYDAFNELPYLRVRGDYGSGKSRFLLTVGSLMYKPIFASGASTVSPIFRIIDAFRGTLIIDESDFRESDERAEVVKILNNGNARGFPVLRTEVTKSREFDPRAYHVFGPKVIATRGFFSDRALESRCLTEELGLSRLRDDVPLNLPAAHAEEAQRLRNRLLLFRLRNFGKPRDLAALVDRGIEPRLAQIFAPLMSVMDEPSSRERVRALARQYHRDLVCDRSLDLEAQVLEVVRDLAAKGQTISLKDIAAAFEERYGAEVDRRVTPKWIGAILRRRLHLRPLKSHGVYVLPPSEAEKLPRLFEKYGLSGGHGDVGDIPGPQDGKAAASILA